MKPRSRPRLRSRRQARLVAVAKSSTVAAVQSGGCSLCSKCKTIDFDGIFARRCGGKNGRYVKSLGTLPAIQLHAACSLCRLFAALRPHPKINACRSQRTSGRIRGRSRGQRFPARYHLRAFTSLTMTGASRGKYREKPDIALTVAPGYKSSSFTRRKREACIRKGMILVRTKSSTSDQRLLTFQGSQVGTDKIDYGKLRGWVKECQTLHSKCLPQDRLLPPYSKIIDCNVREVVSMSAATPYVALSYVWGPDTSSLSRQHYPAGHSLPDDQLMPKVIVHAMEVVRRLGYSYLWVDQICIDQTNPSERQSQIQHMDLIYKSAALTIVALFGDNVEAGLPGVGDVRRITQPASTTPTGKHLVSALPSLQHYLDQSKWATRGWTYQEAILSDRCLLFTESQVYFSCQTGVRCEAIEEKTDPSSPREASYVPLLRPKLSSRVPQDVLEVVAPSYTLLEFYAHLRNYHGRRTLTNQADTLNAFRGILSRCSFYSFWGVPTLSSQSAPIMMQEQAAAKVLSLGLNWRVARARRTRKMDETCQEPRKDFPSWSWTSVSSEVTYLIPAHPRGYLDAFYFYGPKHSKGPSRAMSGIECTLKFRLGQKEHHDQPPSPQVAPDRRPMRIIPEHNQTIYLETQVYRIPRLKSDFSPRTVRVFDWDRAQRNKLNAYRWHARTDQHVTVHLDRARPDLQFVEGDEYPPAVGLVLLFRTFATNYLSYGILSDGAGQSGMTCALLVKWRDDGKVAERIGTAMAAYDFFDKVEAGREEVELG